MVAKSIRMLYTMHSPFAKLIYTIFKVGSFEKKRIEPFNIHLHSYICQFKDLPKMAKLCKERIGLPRNNFVGPTSFTLKAEDFWHWKDQ